MRFRPFAMLTAVLALLHAVAQGGSAQPGPAPTPVYDTATYADASLVDFSFLRSPRPHGFLRVGKKGTFEWADGRRARFWGINIANRNLWIPRDEIDRVVDTLARAGTNLVRFEAIDSRGALLDVEGQPGTRRLDPDKLDTLHYWIHRLRERDIAYYLDLLDFREFKLQDGIDATLNRGARPYAMFDPHLIALQKEYATQLLTTQNPYAGLRPVDDPHLALLELCNEHGFFISPEGLDRLVEPYRGRLQGMWNRWLLSRYRTRDGVKAAWGSLPDAESPVAGTVALPTLTGGREWPPVRRTDGITFLHDVQRAYFRTMIDHLRSIGLRIPVTAVVSNDVPPDLASVAAECDFLSENFYADHPRFEGNDWEGLYHFRNQNQLREGGPGGFAPFTSALRWENKPVVIREWATVWPNAYRAVSVPQAVAYARLQDYDAMILFGYKTGEYANRLIFFGYEADPAVWGLYSLGAAMFLRGDIAASSSRTDLVYTVGSLFAFPSGITDAHRLAWIMRVNTTLRDALPRRAAARKPVDLVLALARSPLTLIAAAGSQPLVGTLAALGYSASSVEKLMQTGVYRSSTGQITLDTKQGRLLVATQGACMISGEIGGGPALKAGALTARSATDVGTVVALSLDGLPLGRSRRYIVKMVTGAANTGQQMTRTSAAGELPDYRLDNEGTAPVRTEGAPSEQSTQVWIAGRPVVSVDMVNGTWELHVDGSHATFACDTPNVIANVLGRRLVTGKPAP